MSYFSDYGQADASLSKLLGEGPKPTSVSPSKPKRKSQTASAGIRWTWNDEAREQRRQARLGIKLDPNIGKKISHTRMNSELCRQTSIANLKLAQDSNRGRRHSAESRQRWSELAKVREANRVISDETRAKLRKTSRILDVMTPNGVFPSRAAVARAAGVQPATINRWMKKWPEHYYYIKEAK